jgi:hypothetical protein
MIRAYQKKFHLLYKTTCTITNRFYIGIHSTDDPFDGYLGSGKVLRHSLNKYGRDNHKIEYLDLFTTRQDLFFAEKQLVNTKIINNPLCMNIRVGGQGAVVSTPSTRKGQKLSEETCRRMSEAAKGKSKSDKHRRSISEVQKGRKLSEEHKKNIGLKSKDTSKFQRAVVVDGIEYVSSYEASRLTGIKNTTIGKRILSMSKKFLDTYYKDAPKNNIGLQ